MFAFLCSDYPVTLPIRRLQTASAFKELGQFLIEPFNVFFAISRPSRPVYVQM